MKSLRFLGNKAWLTLFISVLCSTHALSQQVIGVDQNGEIRVTGGTQSQGDGNRVFFEALSDARKSGSAASSANSGRNPTQDEVEIMVAGRLLYMIENDSHSLQEELGVSDDILDFMKKGLTAARDFEHQMLFTRIDKMCSQWQQTRLADERLASALEYYDTLAASDNRALSARYNESINAIESNFGFENSSPINSLLIELRRGAERSTYFTWGSLVMSQGNPEDTIEFHCGEEQ